MADIIDKQRYQFLWELVGPIIVRTISHNGRHAVSVVESSDKMVTAGLAGRVWAVRLVLRFLGKEGSIELKGAIDFVGGYVVKTTILV